MGIRRIALVVHPGKERAVAMARELEEWLDKQGIEVGEQETDLVVSLGGDGTMLRAAQTAHACDALILGINFGTVGYLTEVEAGQAFEALESIFAGRHEVEERVMLTCTATSGTDRDEHVALNEVLVERLAGHRLVRLAMTVDGEALASVNADGVIVATPTGSTAYALSAGGPIVSPRAACMVLVPVSAHMIFSRPFVLATDEVVEIGVDPGRSGGETGGASLVLDGVLVGDLESGASVKVRSHPRPLRLVRLSGPGFVHRLRGKLDLPG